MNTHRSTRQRAEIWMAALMAAGILAVCGGILAFFLTISPVHHDPASVPSTPASVSAGSYQEVVRAARTLIRNMAVEENLPGVSVAVAAEGHVVWAEGFGVANTVARTPVTPETRFRIGSISRPITAAGIGLLIERGQMDLDAPVQQYVPAYPTKQWPVSVRQVMGDIGGVHHLTTRGNERIPGRHCDSLDEALSIFVNDPLVYQPGTKHRYAVYGWMLVSKVLEGAATDRYGAFMAREVLGPLGMRGTVLDADPDRSARTEYYFPRVAERTEYGLQDAPDADYSCYAGAGGYVSTPTDLVRFGVAMSKPGFLRSETLAQLQTPLTLVSGVSTDYAPGWKIDTVQIAGSAVRVLSSKGSSAGGTARLIVVPRLGLAVAVTTNTSLARGIWPMAETLVAMFAEHHGSN